MINQGTHTLPDWAVVSIVLSTVGVLAIIAGLLLLVAGLSNHSSTEAQTGIVGFLGGLLMAGFAYALRKLQLIAWRLEVGSNLGDNQEGVLPWIKLHW